MQWVRIDNRLVHGQIIETWLPYTHAKHIIVANDSVAGDDLQQQIMSLAIPQSVTCSFSSVEGLSEKIPTVSGHGKGSTIIIFSSCADVRRALDAGFKFSSVNIGNIHYGPGKSRFLPVWHLVPMMSPVFIILRGRVLSWIFVVCPMIRYR